MNGATQAWHDLLGPDRAAESAEWLLEQLATRGLMFGERPLCTVLRPRFLSRSEFDWLRVRCRLVLGALVKAYKAAPLRPEVMAAFRLAPWERELALEHPDLEPSPVSRLDAFYTPKSGELWFTEYNAETPAGAGYNDALTELFLALPVMREFRNRFLVAPLPVKHQVLHSLLRAYRAGGGKSPRPTIGILDWREVPTQSEFRIFAEYFRSLGFPCVVADPRDSEYRDGVFYAGGQRIDLIYKRVLINELVAEGGLDHPMIRAVRERAVSMVNSFGCKLLHKKSAFAVLSDEQHAELFTPEELEAIRAHVPWTRVVEERHTTFGGGPVDLLPFAAANRERLVLKPNDDYGGAGVILGWTVDDATWTAELTRALERPSIVQERIQLPSEPFPSLVEGRVVFAERIVDTAPFGFDGRFIDACLTRVSTNQLVNVTAGGGSTIPTLLVDPR
ncbi:MAG: hypothetical protein R2909_03820 [Gemmatimonadales bacterium]